MPNRYLRWNDPQFIHNDVNGDPCSEECVTLSDDYASLSNTTMTWPRHVWESLAEHILWERDRRKEEAAKQPKRFIVWRPTESMGWRAGPAEHSMATPLEVFGDGSLRCIFLLAKDENDAILKAKEADLTFGVFAREYLAP